MPDALLPGEPDAAELVPANLTVLLPDGPVALVPLLWRTTLLASSQHSLTYRPLEICAFTKLPMVKNPATHTAAT